MKYADIFASPSLETAKQLWQQLLLNAPNDVALLDDYAFWLKHFMGDYQAARELLEKATQLAPNQAKLQWHLAFIELKLGDYASGWQHQEARWQVMTEKRDEFAGTMWPVSLSLQAMSSKTVMLWPEQGLGDVLQFCRYALLVQRAGVKVYLQVPRSMHALIANSFARLTRNVQADNTHPLHVFCYEDNPQLHYDFHASLMSLPLHCGTDEVSKIPAFDAYLFAQEPMQAVWQDYMGTLELNGKLKVGLVWAGAHKEDDFENNYINPLRSLTLTQFKPLLHNVGAKFFSLQKGESSSQLYQAVEQDLIFSRIVDCSESLQDWSHTAALIANLDLVITCDTSVAHLAGAMGKPVWVLSRFDGCWRWLVGRSDSPWYPSMRLFHQKEPHNWHDVMIEVRQALDFFIASRP